MNTRYIHNITKAQQHFMPVTLLQIHFLFSTFLKTLQDQYSGLRVIVQTPSGIGFLNKDCEVIFQTIEISFDLPLEVLGIEN